MSLLIRSLSMFARGGGRIWSSIKSGHGCRMLMSTMGAPSSSSPWLMLPPGRDSSSGDIIHNFYSLADKKHRSFDGGFSLEDGTRFVGSSHGWLALFNARRNHLFLTNPLSQRRIDLPPVDKLPDPEINLTNGHASVSKVILSCSPDEGDGVWRALMAYSPENRMALCRGGGGGGWKRIGSDEYRYKDYGKLTREYKDFVYCRPGKSFVSYPSFEGVNYRYDDYSLHCIEYWFLGDADEYPECMTIYRPSWIKEIPKEFNINTNSGEIGFSFYLVFTEQMNQLLYVVRFVSDNKTVRFMVFRIDNGRGFVNRVRLVRPDQAGSLDGLAIFIGINHSFAVTAADFPNIKPNSIYFASPDSVRCEIFDYESQTVSPCYYPYPSQVESSIAPPPLWFSPTPS